MVNTPFLLLTTIAAIVHLVIVSRTLTPQRTRVQQTVPPLSLCTTSPCHRLVITPVLLPWSFTSHQIIHFAPLREQPHSPVLLPPTDRRVDALRSSSLLICTIPKAGSSSLYSTHWALWGDPVPQPMPHERAHHSDTVVRLGAWRRETAAARAAAAPLRAVFLRDPVQRIASAHHDKLVRADDPYLKALAYPDVAPATPIDQDSFFRHFVAAHTDARANRTLVDARYGTVRLDVLRTDVHLMSQLDVCHLRLDEHLGTYNFFARAEPLRAAAAALLWLGGIVDAPTVLPLAGAHDRRPSHHAIPPHWERQLRALPDVVETYALLDALGLNSPSSRPLYLGADRRISAIIDKPPPPPPPPPPQFK